MAWRVLEGWHIIPRSTRLAPLQSGTVKQRPGVSRPMSAALRLLLRRQGVYAILLDLFAWAVIWYASMWICGIVVGFVYGVPAASHHISLDQDRIIVTLIYVQGVVSP